jgi:hypothetical protein
MEKQIVCQGIGYALLRLRNDNNNIITSERSLEVGGSMIASFAVSTIEDLVDLFYRRSDELSFDEFTAILSKSMTDAMYDGAKTGISSILKEALNVETFGEIAIDFTSGFFYDYSRGAYKHYRGEIDADQLIESTTKSVLDNVLGSLTGAAWGYGRNICSHIVGLGATIGTALATPAGVIAGSLFCTGVTACIRTTIINNAKKDAYARIENSLGSFYHHLENQEGISIIPLQIVDDISDFTGTSGFRLKGLIPMYNIISDFEEYKYRKNVLVNMEKEFLLKRAGWDYKTYQMKQTMLDMQRQRVGQLEMRYDVAMEELKRDFELKVRYGVEEQYRQYLSAVQYINGEIETKCSELKKMEREHGAVSKELELKREVNRKLIGLLETMDINDEGSSDEVKRMVGAIIGQLSEDSFVAAVNPEDIVPILR